MDEAEKARRRAEITAETDPVVKQRLKAEFIALLNAPLVPHEALNTELSEDIDAYTAGGQLSFPISDKLAASVVRWPVATEELVFYRGQPKGYSKIPMSTIGARAFFSATIDLKTARDFAGPGGNIFKITLKPGVRFLYVTRNRSEHEVFVASDGVGEYGDAKVRVDDKYLQIWNMAIPVTIAPRPRGGRRTRRYPWS